MTCCQSKDNVYDMFQYRWNVSYMYDVFPLHREHVQHVPLNWERVVRVPFTKTTCTTRYNWGRTCTTCSLYTEDVSYVFAKWGVQWRSYSLMGINSISIRRHMHNWIVHYAPNAPVRQRVANKVMCYVYRRTRSVWKRTCCQKYITR